jgi:hypothetical protein
MRGRCALHAVLLGCALAVPLRLSAQTNLLTNPTFDTDVNGWTAGGCVTLGLSTANADVMHPAGSALVTRLLCASIASPYVAYQCVPVTAGNTYDAAGDLFIAAGNSGSLGAVVTEYWDGADCTGTSLQIVGPGSIPPKGQWVHTSTLSFAPFAALSASVEMRLTITGPPEGSGPDTVQFDDMRFARVPIRGDANADGFVDVADVFYLINFLFAGGPTPPDP